MRVVFDCNVFVSFLISKGEAISFLFYLWGENHFLVYLSEETEREIYTVLDRFVDKKYLKKKEVDEFLEFLESNTIKIKTNSRLDLSIDKKDNCYLNLVKDAEADYLVTGDKKHLLALKNVGRAKIITVRELIEILKERK
jgi:uncharacterized protein